jgi:hypothetical protein
MLREDKLSNLNDDLRAAAAGDDDAYRKAKKRLHDHIIDQLRSIGEACMEPKQRASMTRNRLATEKVYVADDEEWADGPEFDELTTAETEAFDALVDTHAGALRLYFRRTLTFA